MSNARTCPQCGGSSHYYSQNRQGMVCGSCGYVIRSEQQQQEDANYDRCIALAKEHLSVGNWDECKRIVKPLCTKRPADKNLYLILLAATTKGYEDFLFNNSAECAAAAEYWDKLTMLRCVNATMREYAKLRIRKREENRRYELGVIGLVIAICIISTIMTLGLATAGNLGCFFMVAVTVVGWIWGINWLKDRHDPENKLLPGNYNGQNPFRS